MFSGILTIEYVRAYIKYMEWIYFIVTVCDVFATLYERCLYAYLHSVLLFHFNIYV